MANWTTVNIPSQKGKLAIVTGAGGIGFFTALELAKAGAEVIVAGRSEERGLDAVRRIKASQTSAVVRHGMLDLASLKSVASFAEQLLKQGRPVDLLINNAGVMALPKRRVTVDGFEMQFGTNHLGHFALTGRLLPLLLPGTEPRVVNVSSLAHRRGSIRFDDLQWENGYNPWGAYCQSKLANLLFTFELQRLSDANGWGLMANAAHPGYARTELIQKGPGSSSLFAKLSGLFGTVLSQSAEAGAWPTLLAATATDAKKSGYYGPDGINEMKGMPGDAKIAARALDLNVAAKLWSLSEQLTGVVFAQAAERPQA